MMTRPISKLKSIIASLPLVQGMVREARFLNELTAHRDFITPYKLPHSLVSPRAVETPLLIGYFETFFGLGEYARGLASALAATGTPFAVYPYNSYTRRAR
jgi:hypothetical protein